MTETTRKIISKFFDDLLTDTERKIQNETIASILENRNPVTLELFAENNDNCLYFLVCQRVTTSFSTRLGKVMEKLTEELIKAQGGQIMSSPKPYDLKFKLSDGKEYWIEIKSIDGQNSSNRQTISERKKMQRKMSKYSNFVSIMMKQNLMKIINLMEMNFGILS